MKTKEILNLTDLERESLCFYETKGFFPKRLEPTQATEFIPLKPCIG